MEKTTKATKTPKITKKHTLYAKRPKSHSLILGSILLTMSILGCLYLFTSVTNSATQQPTIKPSPTVVQQKLQDHASEYFTVSYPETWYPWNFGRGVDLDYFQINSLPEYTDAPPTPNRAHIAIDVQSLYYTPSTTLEEHKALLEASNAQNPQNPVVISETTIDGKKALVYERTVPEQPGYEKTIWFVTNDKKYIVTLMILAESAEKIQALKEQHTKDFTTVLSSLKIK